ncbi:MarR family winged helix-turn-helix transcriptional regulator [Nitrospirillum iridis]|uniref:DNA-binding MarR family transcriptional regulator n=1 Tax=Nitrospirillum iridis TaxID=765888 RepID=A0A7X0AYA8_9PROT|nr:MarR family transcriptional regulator [Nitrospirillum iridis]MBB6251546.1 DNA-binding MarR family transcriptional regulator [Nitrospirillum iridis]
MPDALAHFRAEDAIALCVIDVANALVRHSEPLLEEAGLTAPQWTVLMNVAGDRNFNDGPALPANDPHSDAFSADMGRQGCIFSSEIAAARGLSRPHISATVTELLRKGLIRQEDDPSDRRRKLLSATTEGLAVLRRLQPLRQAVNDLLLADLDAHQRRTLLEALRIVRDRSRRADHIRPYAERPPALRHAS